MSSFFSRASAIVMRIFSWNNLRPFMSYLTSMLWMPSFTKTVHNSLLFDTRCDDVTRVSQITMTTAWLLLLLLIVSSQSVDSQSTTDDEVCDDARVKREFEILSLRQEQIFEQLQLILKRLGESCADR